MYSAGYRITACHKAFIKFISTKVANNLIAFATCSGIDAGGGAVEMEDSQKN